MEISYVDSNQVMVQYLSVLFINHAQIKFQQDIEYFWVFINTDFKSCSPLILVVVVFLKYLLKYTIHIASQFRYLQF